MPRFLFRASSNDRGGGPLVQKISPTEILPAAFHTGKASEGCDPYQMSEAKLFEMANGHWCASRVNTEFSSWAASLHLVLCYAHTLQKEGESQVHVAMIDTVELDHIGVRVWHVPHLIYQIDPTEYLAHGVIRGPYYKAIEFQKLQNHGLGSIFPEIKVSERMGAELRQSMFASAIAYSPIKDTEFRTICNIASLFEDFSLPFAAALFCIRKRSWNHEMRFAQTSIPASKEIEKIIQALDPNNPSSLLSRSLIKAMKSNNPSQWLSESWIQGNNVVTDWSPDTRQWIDLLHALAQHSATTVVLPPTALSERPGRTKRKAAEESEQNTKKLKSTHQV